MSAGTVEYNNQNVIINHNPNSFYYKSAQLNGDMSLNIVDIERQCSNIKYGLDDDGEDIIKDYKSVDWDETACNSANFATNINSCQKVADCKNFYEVSELYNKNNAYSASGQLYLDNSEDYKKTIVQSINLSVGSLFLVYVIINKALE